MLLVAFLLVNAPNCHLSFVLASVVQDDAVNCNKYGSLEGLMDFLAFLVQKLWQNKQKLVREIP